MHLTLDIATSKSLVKMRTPSRSLDAGGLAVNCEQPQLGRPVQTLEKTLANLGTSCTKPQLQHAFEGEAVNHTQAPVDALWTCNNESECLLEMGQQLKRCRREPTPGRLEHDESACMQVLEMLTGLQRPLQTPRWPKFWWVAVPFASQCRSY